MHGTSEGREKNYVERVVGLQSPAAATTETGPGTGIRNMSVSTCEAQVNFGDTSTRRGVTTVHGVT